MAKVGVKNSAVHIKFNDKKTEKTSGLADKIVEL